MTDRSQDHAHALSTSTKEKEPTQMITREKEDLDSIYLNKITNSKTFLPIIPHISRSLSSILFQISNFKKYI